MQPHDLGVGSHVPFLAAAVARTTGPVYEFGTGWWSSSTLHFMCAGRRPLYSFETDEDWMRQMATLFESPGHIFQRVVRWDDVKIPSGIAVAFVDCSVDSTKKEHHRPRLVKRLKEAGAHFIAVHDLEADIRPAAGDYGWSELDGLFRYASTFKMIRPWTTVYSDVEEFAL